jgi:NADH:ubiquinone oxidoreductase subunit 6 (subunit J)
MRFSVPILVLIAALILAPAAIALTRRNLIHGALLLTASWAGVAAFYLWAGAEFVAFAQVLIYVGAISMVILFAVLLTGRSRADLAVGPAPHVRRMAGAIAVALPVAGVVAAAAIRTPLAAGKAQALPLGRLGEILSGPEAAALLGAGAILTVALLGAVVLAAAGRAEP